MTTLGGGPIKSVPAGILRDGRNSGGGPAKVLAPYVVEKDKPGATPVK